MFGFGNNNKGVVGLDIGSSSVKMVKLSKDGDDYVVNAAARSDIDAADGSDKQKKSATVAAIKDCLKAGDVSDDYVVCGLCGSEVVVRPFSFPNLPAEQIAQAVKFEAEQVCPFDTKNIAVDYQVVENNTGQEGGKIDGILVAAAPSAIEKKTQLTASAFAKCALMDADDLAILNCFSYCESQSDSKSVAVIDIGSKFTNVIILGSDGLPFIRDLPYAANDIIASLLEQGDKAADSPSALEAVKKALNTSQVPENELEKACEGLVAGINKTLRYYSIKDAVETVSKIYVCGGFSTVPGFVEVLGKYLFAEVILWNPFSKIRPRKDAKCEVLLDKEGPSMALAAGLAMRTI
jgi:type IV pilus assembly protein PilM